MQYPKHNNSLAEALTKLDPVKILNGNLHGVNAMLMVMDLIRCIQRSSSTFIKSEFLFNRFLNALIEYCESDEC